MPKFMSDHYDKPRVTLLAISADAPGSGKDTLAAMLAEHHPEIVIVRFADTLTEEVYQQFAHLIDRETFMDTRHDATLKDAKMGIFRPQNVADKDYCRFLVQEMAWAPNAPMSIRDHLDTYGTKYQRELMGDDNRYVRAGLERAWELMCHGQVPVITDARFPNEVAGVRSLGGIVIKVTAPWAVKAAQGKITGIAEGHLKDVQFDAIIENVYGDPSKMKGQFHAKFRF